MTDKLVRYESENIGERIYTIRGQKVIMDFDLAAIYIVTTKRLNEQVKRNEKRFPSDFFSINPQRMGGFESANNAFKRAD